MKPRELFDAVALAAPRFGEVMRDHVVDNDELLPHLLMADLLRYVGALAKTDDSHAELLKIFELLEVAFVSGDADTENAIAVSFIEHIDAEPFFSAVEPLFGPALRGERNRQIRWQPAR
jgi:hypothetical protein